MNNARRKVIENIKNKLYELKDNIDEILSEEQVEYALDNIDETIGNLEEAQE